MLHGGHPIADGLIDGVLQCAAARAHRSHLGSQQLHAEDVQRLALHVLLAHVHHTLQAEQGGHGGHCHSMLAGAGLGDDPALAHPPGQQYLPQGVVDFMGPGVVQVFPLEVDFQPQLGTDPAGMIQRRGATGIVDRQLVKLLPIGLVLAGLAVGALQFPQGRQQCFRDVLPAIDPEMTAVVGLRVDL